MFLTECLHWLLRILRKLLYTLSMKRLILTLILIVAIGSYLYYQQENKTTGNQDQQLSLNQEEQTMSPPPPANVQTTTMEIPSYKLLTMPTHFYQTFNNCGPATLAMILNYYNVSTTQAEIGLKLRPYQNPKGDNDDKSVSVEELQKEAEIYGFNAYYLPNGTVEKVKMFIANDIPVVTVTWLTATEDVGHYRIITGYDDKKEQFMQNDSYQGPNRTYSYEEFLALWQPFNYRYLIVVEPEKKHLVEQILGEEIDPQIAWENALLRAKQEATADPNKSYPIFNQAVAYFYLGKFEETKSAYEQVQFKVPPRMLWYQYEPIKAYKELKEYNSALALIQKIISTNNKAFAELYKLRGDIYVEQNLPEKAKQEYELAILYNKNYQEATDALEKVL